MVDSERGVGRPDRALEVGRAVDRSALPTAVRVELAIAMSGARLDLGQPERALLELEIPELDPDRAFEWSPGLFAARADRARGARPRRRGGGVASAGRSRRRGTRRRERRGDSRRSSIEEVEEVHPRRGRVDDEAEDEAAMPRPRTPTEDRATPSSDDDRGVGTSEPRRRKTDGAVHAAQRTGAAGRRRRRPR